MRKDEGGSSQFTTNTLLIFTQQVWEFVVVVRVLKVLVEVYDLGEGGVSEILLELTAGEEALNRLGAEGRNKLKKKKSSITNPGALILDHPWNKSKGIWPQINVLCYVTLCQLTSTVRLLPPFKVMNKYFKTLLNNFLMCSGGLPIPDPVNQTTPERTQHIRIPARCRPHHLPTTG